MSMEMSCDNLIYYLGSGLRYDLDHNMDNSDAWSINIRAINRLVSAFLILFVVGFFGLSSCFCRKRKKNVVKTISESSIFSFLKDLQKDQILNKKFSQEILRKESPNTNNFCMIEETSLHSVDSKEIEMLKNKMILSMKNYEKENLDLEINQEIYICNFYECCCVCLSPCLQNIYNIHISPFLSKINENTITYFHENIKFFCFYFIIVGAFLYHPVQILFSLSLSSCNSELIDNKAIFILLRVSFSLIDLISNSLSALLFNFSLSFLGTKNEFLKIYYFDKYYRARLIYYHLKKSLILAFLFFIWKLFFKLTFLFQVPMSEVPESPQSQIFFIFSYLFLLAMVNFYHSFSTSSIDQNCCIIKAHARYFCIQNHLLKKIPNHRDMYLTIKKCISKTDEKVKKYQCLEDSFEEEQSINKQYNDFKLDLFSKKIQKKCENLKMSLEIELEIIKQQKFKNILRNNGYLRYLPILLMIYLVFDIVLSVIFGLMFLYVGSDEGARHHWMDHTARIGTSILSFLECSLFPFLFFFCIKKTTFLTKNKL